MTDRKHFKQLVRERMRRTGERYTVARRHVAGAPSWELRGGLARRAPRRSPTCSPTSASRRGGAPLSEAMILGAGGGLGAGYILWEFESHGYRGADARLPAPVAVPGPLGERAGRAARPARRAARDRRGEGRGRRAGRPARPRPAGDRLGRPVPARPARPAALARRLRRPAGRGLRARGRRRTRSTTARRRARRSPPTCSPPRAAASAPTSTG